MFGFFKNKRRSAEVLKPNVASESHDGISYDHDLIDTFQAEHQSLLRLFGDIRKAAEEEDYKIVHVKLKKFTSILRGHLLTENVKLYVYLSKELAHDPENKEIIMSFRREMMQIGKVVNRFVTVYDRPLWSLDMRQDFLPELIAIGEILIERINREENTLYPLYMPKENYLY